MADNFIKPFNDSLVLSLKSMIDKFPRTDTLPCYSYCFCVPCGDGLFDVKGEPKQVRIKSGYSFKLH